MQSQGRGEARFHALLIGIDGYVHAPLGGCVNDIDAVQRVLLDRRLGITADRITRLASRDGAPATPAERPATRDNIRDALARLGSDEVAAGDRVFIYYSGHGARVEAVGNAGQRFHREALVPVDVRGEPDDPHLLFDFELNHLLRGIAARTSSVTLVLDCCHAAGAWRDASEARPRFLDLAELGLRAPVRIPARPASRGARQDEGHDDGQAEASGLGHVADCQVVTACQSHELAYEARGEDGRRLGFLTRALTEAVEASAAGDLATLTWAQIWQPMRAAQARRSNRQTLAMNGDLARLVFGGPPVDGDAGIPVRRTERGYEVDAGTLAGITEGAELAVYGELPRYFPTLGSRDDRDHRLGLLRIVSAGQSAATAMPDGTPVTLPPGARARLVRAGKRARLRYAIEPHDDQLAVLLARSPLLEAIAAPAEPDVKLVHSDGKWFVTDAIHGVRTDEPVLFALHPAELDCAAAVLEHYCAYVRPLQMASRARDLRGELVLEVLSCAGQLAAADAQGADLPLARSRAAGSYQVRSGDRICLRVQNRSRHRLHVTLVNAAASGRVQHLGDETLDAGASHIFWAHSELGSPFQMVPPPNVACCADRMVAIATTADHHDLRYLRVDRSFAQIIQKTRDAEGSKDIDAGAAPPPIIHWTSAQAVIETRAR
ncbi:MAG: caspase family protein [Kofleriaceae bacterium]